MGYLRPAPYRGISSYRAHTRRNPPSREPGVDYYMPIGTPLRAPASGIVFETYDGIGPATGRFVTIDLDDGRRVRYLHLLSRSVKRGDRVKRGDVFAISGATGYGVLDWSARPETGGAHVHVSLFPRHLYTFAAMLDFDAYADETPSAAGSGAAPFNPNGTDEDDMFTDSDRARLDATYAALFGPSNVSAPKMTWERPFGEEPGGAYYGVLDILIYTQTLVGELSGQLAGVAEAVAQLAPDGGAVDMAAIKAAAEKGARDALGDLVLVVGTANKTDAEPANALDAGRA